jgi:ABC-type Fe3+-hydroxamate transport system substrate-binding protein
MIDNQAEEYMRNYDKQIELIKAKLQILDEVYVVKDPNQTYINVAEKINLLLNLLEPKLN